MNPLKILPLFLLFAPALAQNAPVPGAEPPKAEKETPKLTESQQSFLNLPEERRKDFFKNLGEANRLFQQKRIFETLNALNKAEAIFADSPEVLNIRGACYVEIRAFDKAMEAFQKALQLAPNNPSVMFNIGEVLFVTKEWQKAHDTLSEVLKGVPKEQMALARLVEFKILLCKKKLGRKEEALALANKYDIDDDSPFHCYAKAALAYEDDRMIEAEEWLARAGRIFRNPEILSPWQDTLVEYGYLTRFYGNDLNSDEAQ